MVKPFKDFLSEINCGNIFSRKKEGGALVTGSLGGNGAKPYVRVNSGGRGVRYSVGGSSSGKQKIYQNIFQKMSGGGFRRTRNTMSFGAPKATKIKLFKTKKSI